MKKILIPIGAAVLLLGAFGVWLLRFRLTPKQEPPPSPACSGTPEITKFATDPGTIVRGSSATLEWEVQNYDFIQVDQEVGEVEAVGSQEISPTATTTYTLTAKCGEEEIIKETTLKVEEEFKVESVKVSASPTSKTTTACSTPITITFTGKIKASRSGTVTYRWEKPDGTVTGKRTVKFSKAETKTVTNTWSVYAGTSGWQRIKIISPKAFTSEKASFSTSCKFAVTKVTSSYNISDLGDTVCTVSGTNIYLSGQITASKAGTVKYNWVIGLSGPGIDPFTSPSPTETLVFSKAGTKNVSTTISGLFPPFGIDPGTYTGTMYLQVTSPNSIKSSTKTYTHTLADCP